LSNSSPFTLGQVKMGGLVIEVGIGSEILNNPEFNF